MSMERVRISPRLPDWRARLAAYVAEAARHPFKDGTHDCALFLAGGIAAMTGTDYALPWRGRYTTTRGGLRILRRDGFADHVALAAHFLDEVPVSFLKVGDGAVIYSPDGPALGIVQGERVYVLMRTGLGHVSLIHAKRGFVT